MKKQLPEKYAVEIDINHSLWNKFYSWLVNKYPLSRHWEVKEWYYIGYVNANETTGYSGTLVWDSKTEKDFPTLITLEFWDECVNGRKIVGYKAPFDMFDSKINKGLLFELNNNKYWDKSERFAFPIELVEAYFEAVHEEEKLEVVDWKYYAYEYYTEIKIKGKLTQEKVDKIKEVINE